MSSIDLVTQTWVAAALTEPARIADRLRPMLRRGAGMLLGTGPVSTGSRVCLCAAIGRLAWRALRSCSGPVSVGPAVVLAGVTGNAIGQAQGAVADLALLAGGLAPGCPSLSVRKRIKPETSEMPRTMGKSI